VPAQLPRIRQVVLAARDLDPVANRLQTQLGLGEPFSDPGVEYFGLRNAVFALGDTFIEVVSPVRPGTAAGRLLERRGGDTGYMVMFQVDDLAAARERVAAEGVREVFAVTLDDIAEVHLHPADMRVAIVSLSEPRPVTSWRWGGPHWDRRSVPGNVEAIRVAVRDPEPVAERWRHVIGGLPGVEFAADDDDDDDDKPGLTEIRISAPHDPFELAGVRFGSVPSESKEVA
jgi:Glyoxalase-like domain